MTLSGQSDSPPAAGELSVYYTVLEYVWQGTMMMTISLVQHARSEREAAERSAGLQLARECAPRRIRVYREKSVDFEWRRVDNYLCEVGEVEG